MGNWVWFVLFFIAGFFAYTVFGLQIAIMRRCGRRVYWMLSGGEAFDSGGCKKYMRKVIWINLLILLVLEFVITQFIPRGGAGGFNWGIVLGYLVAGGKTGCNAQNVKEAGEAFKQFVRPGYEERVASILEETQKNPDVLYTIQKPRRETNGKGGMVPSWVLWACVGMFVAAAVLMVGVYIPGVRRQTEETAAEQVESAKDEGYNQGYYAGYDKGKEDQWVSDRQSLVVRGKNLKMIIESVESEYGIEPAKAYDILNTYNNNADHGGYSWEEYQEAIQVIIYTVSLIPYR